MAQPLGLPMSTDDRFRDVVARAVAAFQEDSTYSAEVVTVARQIESRRGRSQIRSRQPA